MFKEQKILSADENYSSLGNYIRARGIRKILLVHGNSFYKIPIAEFFAGLNIPTVHFTEFKPNPAFESVAAGVEIYRAENCDAVMAVGGGSAIDVAKCIKLFASSDAEDYLQQKIIPNAIPLIAAPTTVGTGSESTQFAVIYRAGEKFSVEDTSALPDAILLDISPLKYLSDYQKKAGILDALCHSLEASWSVNSNEVAREFALEAIRLIYANKDFYLSANPSGTCLSQLSCASRLAGKAINLAKTTAGHAMSYALTTRYGIAHGQAAALCVAEVWAYMNARAEDGTLKDIFSRLAACMGFSSVEAAIGDFRNILSGWNLDAPLSPNATDAEINLLADSVNVQRLANNPVHLDKPAIENIYKKILKRSFDER